MGFLIYEDLTAFLSSLVLPAAEAYKYRKEVYSFFNYAVIRFKKYK